MVFLLYNESDKIARRFQDFETFFKSGPTYWYKECKTLTALLDKKEDSISIALLKQGDHDTFAQFVEMYQNMVFVCCKTVGLQGHDIEDAASETFMTAYKNIRQFNGNSRLSSWLWKIAYYKSIDYRRKQEELQSFSGNDIDNFVLPDVKPPVSLVESREINLLIWHIVNQLPPAWASAIVLYYREGKSIQEIAEILDKPINTVKTFLHRGRSMLYSLLQSVWETSYVK